MYIASFSGSLPHFLVLSYFKMVDAIFTPTLLEPTPTPTAPMSRWGGSLCIDLRSDF